MKLIKKAGSGLEFDVDGVIPSGSGGGSEKILKVYLDANTAELIGWGASDEFFPTSMSLQIVNHNNLFMFAPLGWSTGEQLSATVFQEPEYTTAYFLQSVTTIFTFIDDNTLQMKMTAINYGLDGSVSKVDGGTFTLSII